MSNVIQLDTHRRSRKAAPASIILTSAVLPNIEICPGDIVAWQFGHDHRVLFDVWEGPSGAGETFTLGCGLVYTAEELNRRTCSRCIARTRTISFSGF
jgi:hypothetical protein